MQDRRRACFVALVGVDMKIQTDNIVEFTQMQAELTSEGYCIVDVEIVRRKLFGFIPRIPLYRASLVRLADHVQTQWIKKNINEN
jgi:hypothetical protein